MNPIRYAKRTCTNQEHINAFLAAARVGHLGLTDGLEPYVVPLNFCWLNGSVYFHGAEAGRKTDIMQKTTASVLRSAKNTAPSPIRCRP